MMLVKINDNGDVLDVGDRLDYENDEYVGYTQGEPPTGFSKETMSQYRFDFSTGDVVAKEKVIPPPIAPETLDKIIDQITPEQAAKLVEKINQANG